MSTSRKIKLVLTIVTIIITIWIQQEGNSKKEHSNTLPETREGSRMEGFDFLPSSTTGVVIMHDGYKLSYSEKHEQAEWVAYALSKQDIVSTSHKRPFFINDPKVKTKSADWRNYKNSGYDKGHLCPAGDRRYTKQAHDETFYTSNITPQKHNFNAGIWNRLEQKTRYWAKKNQQLFVITGGILKGDLKTIGKRNKVSVPNYFYKILLDYSQPEIKMIAFLMPHQESQKPLYTFVTSVDAIESKTGIDFFPALPDDLEKRLEKSTNYKNWSFK